MELTIEELDHIIERQLQPMRGRLMNDLGVMQQRIDIAVAERDAAQQELAAIQLERGNAAMSGVHAAQRIPRVRQLQQLADDNANLEAEVARCHEQLEAARQTIADHDEARQLAVEGRQELKREVERLTREVNDLHQGWAADKRAATPAGAVWITEQELYNVIRSAHHAWKTDGTPYRTSALRAIHQLQQRAAQRVSDEAPMPQPVLDVYARWNAPRDGIGGHWTVHAFTSGTHKTLQTEVLLFSMLNNGELINHDVNWRLHLDGITSAE